MSRDFLQKTDPFLWNIPVCLNIWVFPEGRFRNLKGYEMIVIEAFYNPVYNAFPGNSLFLSSPPSGGYSIFILV